MKYTVNEFAAKIRNLYPGDYDDLPDEKLVELWLKKHPNDRERVDFSEQPSIKYNSPIEEKQKTIVYHHSSWVRQLLFGFALLFLLFISFLKNPTSDDFVKELESKYNEKFKNELKQNGLAAGVFGMFSNALDFYLNSNYKRSDLIFFSIYLREVENTPNVIAIGFWDNFYFFEEPFNSKPENSDNFIKPKIYENKEESLRVYLRNDNVWNKKVFENPSSIEKDINGTYSWHVIGSNPDKSLTAIYMPDDQTFTIILN
jgi:hypothetical protein